ncbi:MAG TPA: LON peptidase substrate-binding domain-containing protein [Saprospiraceae bacterium]|nr:LON peptidase substrate-binding domain-containing protein [Saprospiraceae bacterium]HMQ82576.1 LON peptidase substrate-binding domain-containing protein [Saprospiraceae bacterium]
MNDLLPLFPLQLVVFPGEVLPLHIFESRYKQLILECEQEGTHFGIPAYINGKVMEFGTEIRLKSIEKQYPDGEMDIITEGIGVFRINEFFLRSPGKLYAAAKVVRLQLDQKGQALHYDEIAELVEELFGLLRISKSPPTQKVQWSTYDIGHHIGLPLEKEYELLQIPYEVDRQKYIIAHLKQLIPAVREMENLKIKAQMNGHFKNILPPEF